MADIELIVRIDEKLYKDISDAEIMIYGGMRSGKTLLTTLLRAIRNATPLPKGHGRLIDADKFISEHFGKVARFVDDAPTTIEADKGEE